MAQREARVDSPQPVDLFTIGTLAVVHKVVKMPNQSLFVFAEGLERVRVDEYLQLQPFMRASVTAIEEPEPARGPEIEAMHAQRADPFQQIVTSSPTLSDEL